MRRATRTALVNAGLFVLALLFILYLNHDSGSSRTLAWSHIRYSTTSAASQPDYGLCSGLSQTIKPVLVVSRVEADGDPRWLQGPLSEKYHICLYNVDAPAFSDSDHVLSPFELRVPANRGHEAMAYLTFMIDNYDYLPAAGAVFVHGSRFAWHNDGLDYDNKALLMDLDIPAALEDNGYHNLRCDWSTGTCGESNSWGQNQEIKPQGSLENQMTARLEPWNKRAVSDAALPGVFAHLFGGDDSSAAVKLGRQDTLRAQCCAQFVVSRERIRQHTKIEYIALRQWLLGSDSASYDDKVAGRILSYMWHVLFLAPSHQAGRSDSTEPGVDLDKLNTQACPSAEQCYCRLYKRCNLECTSHGSCAGQYSVPKDFKLPDDWIAKHS